MASADSERDFLHFQWTLPGGLPGGPAEATIFSIIATEMLIKDAPPFVEGLRGVIDERNLNILTQAVRNLSANPQHGPEQPHVIAFTSAPTSNTVVLQAGSQVLFTRLEKRWPGKTISLIPVLWELFQKIEQVATRSGFVPKPPPSPN